MHSGIAVSEAWFAQRSVLPTFSDVAQTSGVTSLYVGWICARPSTRSSWISSRRSAFAFCGSPSAMTRSSWSATAARSGGVGPRPASSGVETESSASFLGAEVFEPRLQPREPLFAAFGGEPSLLERLVVALERLLGAGNFGADGCEPLLDLRPRPFRFLFGLRQRLCDEVGVAVERGKLLEDGVFELVPR